MRCVVTGGAGYIGSVTSSLLIDAGHEVTVIDNLTTGHRDAVPSACTFVDGDIRDQESMKELLRGHDAVLHFAAKSIVPESVTHPDIYWDNNVGGSLALLDAMDAADVRKIVFSSTAAVYGNPVSVPIQEDAPTVPTSPYGETKLAIDQAITERAAAGLLTAVSLRYFNVAGAHGHLGERHHPETHLIPNILESLTEPGGSGLQVYGTDWPTPDGTCIRDYVHVVDLARAHVLALGAPAAKPHTIINLGSGSGYSVKDVIDAAGDVTGLPVPWTATDRRAGDPERLIASVDRAQELLDWTAQRSLRDMVDDAWRFHRGRHDGT